MLPSGQKLTLGLLATITHQVVPFHAYAPFPAHLPFLSASWKSCSVSVFRAACNSSWVLSKWRPFSFIFNFGNRRVGWVEGDNRVGLVKNSLVKRKCEMAHCHYATASSFVTKVQGEDFTHFHAVAVKLHSSMQNWLFDLPGQILCEQPLDV
jgi:hypothetical protein